MSYDTPATADPYVIIEYLRTELTQSQRELGEAVSALSKVEKRPEELYHTLGLIGELLSVGHFRIEHNTAIAIALNYILESRAAYEQENSGYAVGAESEVQEGTNVRDAAWPQDSNSPGQTVEG